MTNKLTPEFDSYLFYIAKDDIERETEPFATIKEALAAFEEEYEDNPTICIGVLSIEDGEYISDTVWEWDYDRDRDYDIEIDDEGELEIPYYGGDDAD